MHAVHLAVTFTDRSAGVAPWTRSPDSQEAAQGFADFLKSAPEETGVTLDREGIWVAEILAHA